MFRCPYCLAATDRPLHINGREWGCPECKGYFEVTDWSPFKMVSFMSCYYCKNDKLPTIMIQMEFPASIVTSYACMECYNKNRILPDHPLNLALWDCTLTCEEGNPIQLEDGRWKPNVFENALHEEIGLSSELRIGEIVRYAK